METLPKVICGLGNNGDQYHKTRHNVGFLAIDKIASDNNCVLKQHNKIDSGLVEISVNNHDVKILKPNGFINLSGSKIRKLCDYFKININQVLVLHDDLDIIVGKCKLSFGGGSGGHNGLKDIISHSSENFWRIKIGIGRPSFGDKDQIISYVLNRPTLEESQVLENATDLIIKTISIIYSKGMEPAKTFLHTETSA
jgi:peptidyl-tRNA hydrolase, PTH1 family